MVNISQIPKNKKRATGIALAWFYVVMNIFSGIDNYQDGLNSVASDNFIAGFIAMTGIFLYLTRKKHNANQYYLGSKIIELLLLTTLVIFLIISFTSPLRNWYESPLAWSITPIWAITAYFIAKFHKST